MAFPLMKELRTHLTFDEFVKLYDAAQKADGYTLVSVFEENQCVALMGYRILHDFVHGKHLYVDDLVVTEAKRSQGLGENLKRSNNELGTFVWPKWL